MRNGRNARTSASPCDGSAHTGVALKWHGYEHVASGPTSPDSEDTVRRAQTALEAVESSIELGQLPADSSYTSPTSVHHVG
jgi:hypothetical protein